MRQPGLSKLHICAIPDSSAYLRRIVQPDDRRVRKPDAVIAPVDARPGDKSGGRLHALRFARQSVLKAVPADAARAVSAHFAHRAVGVVKAHGVVARARRPVDCHQTVCADGQMPVAEDARQRRQPLRRELLHQIVENDEVIPRAVHLRKIHGLPPLFPNAPAAAALRFVSQVQTLPAFPVLLYCAQPRCKCHFMLETSQKVLFAGQNKF